MKILIYGINFSPELTGIGKYSGEMADWMVESGHSVRVVTAPPYYPNWKISKEYKNCFSRSLWGKIEVTRCPLYVPSSPSAVARILHLLSFSVSSLIPLLRNFWWKPDVVILIIPTIFCSLQTILLAKITGAKSIVHIQDYEIDAMFGLSMLSNKLIKKIAFWFEGIVLNLFDNVSSISEAMVNRARSKGVDRSKLLFFPNWSDEIETFPDSESNYEFLDGLSVSSDKKIILYAGNMGDKQGLETVIYVAKELECREDIHFLFVGEGVAKSKLKKLTENMALNNITFSPLVSNENLSVLLASAHCHLVIQKEGAADSVLPSKLTNILAAGGNSVITANPNTSLGHLCHDNKGIAILVNPESVPALAAGIIEALEMPSPNFVALDYAKKSLKKEIILNRFISEIS